MKVQWKKVLVKTIVWLAVEFTLNLLGIDSLADYSEFIYEQQAVALSHIHQPAIVMRHALLTQAFNYPLG